MTARFPVPSIAIPPRGLILVDGLWRVRRAGFLAQRELTCYNDHHVQLAQGGRINDAVIKCGHKPPPGHFVSCSARLYLFRATARAIFAMDLTEAEDNALALAEMDFDDVIVWFGLSFSHKAEA